MGCAGVQMATRFIGTYECDADAKLKNVLLNAKEEDITLMKSPVGLPARGVRTNLQFSIENIYNDYSVSNAHSTYRKSNS